MREPLSAGTSQRGIGRLLRQRAVLVWLVFLLACAVVISRTTFTADLSAFLPRSPSAGQRVLVDQLRDGLVSRLILVGIEGGDPAARATLSRNVAAALRGDAQFASVNNGEPVSEARDQQFIFAHRYVLSPAVTPQRFSVDGLHQALGDSLDLLGSSAGMFSKDLLPHDPTGEVATLVNRLDSGAQPSSQDGVWASRDGKRAVLVVQTTGAGSDTDAQARAMAAVQHAFDAATRALPNPASYRLLMTGPGVFSVETRDNIKHDVARLSAVSLVLIVALLLVVYRSPLTLVLGLLPVLSGVAAGLGRGESGVRHGAWHHPRFRHDADRRSGGLFDLSVRAVLAYADARQRYVLQPVRRPCEATRRCANGSPPTGRLSASAC